MDNTPIIKFSAPNEHSHRPILSSKPILNPYELRPKLIELVQNQTFSGIVDEDPYLHLQNFEDIYNSLHLEGMSNETTRWILFPFSLRGKARQWYIRTEEKKTGDWETLRTAFCTDFYPTSKVVDLRTQIIGFKQKPSESMSSSWERFDLLTKSGPNLAL
jgi:hypothetical protein